MENNPNGRSVDPDEGGADANIDEQDGVDDDREAGTAPTDPDTDADTDTWLTLHAEEILPSPEALNELLQMIQNTSIPQSNNDNENNITNQQVLDELHRISESLIRLQQQEYQEIASARDNSRNREVDWVDTAPTSTSNNRSDRNNNNNPLLLLDHIRTRINNSNSNQGADPPALHRFSSNATAADPPAAEMMQLLWDDAVQKIHQQNNNPPAATHDTKTNAKEPQFWMAEHLSPAAADNPSAAAARLDPPEYEDIHNYHPYHATASSTPIIISSPRADPPEEDDRKMPARPTPLVGPHTSYDDDKDDHPANKGNEGEENDEQEVEGDPTNYIIDTGNVLEAEEDARDDGRDATIGPSENDIATVPSVDTVAAANATPQQPSPPNVTTEVDGEAMTVIMKDAMVKMSGRLSQPKKAVNPILPVGMSDTKPSSDSGNNLQAMSNLDPPESGDPSTNLTNSDPTLSTANNAVSLDSTPGAFRMTAIPDDTSTPPANDNAGLRSSGHRSSNTWNDKRRLFNAPATARQANTNSTSANGTPSGARPRAVDPPEDVIVVQSASSNIVEEQSTPTQQSLADASSSGPRRLRYVGRNSDGSGGSIVHMMDDASGDEVIAHVTATSNNDNTRDNEEPSAFSFHPDDYDTAVANSLSTAPTVPGGPQPATPPQRPRPAATPPPAAAATAAVSRAGLAPPPQQEDVSNQLIPVCANNGRVYTASERVQLAQKKGICVRCLGVKTHKTKMIKGRVAITNGRVYQGHCVRCEPSHVPPIILDQFNARHFSSAVETETPTQNRSSERRSEASSSTSHHAIASVNAESTAAVPSQSQETVAPVQQSGTIMSPVSAEIVSEDPASNAQQIQRLTEAVTSLQQEMARRVPQAEVIGVENRKKSKKPNGCVIM